MRLADMTWQEVRDHLRSHDALLVPVGTCEQHGPHLPLGCDTLIAEAFADRISDATRVPVAPTLAYGVNLPCDLFTSGTAGLTLDTLRDCIRDLLADWKRQGFRRFFIVTAHACAFGGFGFAHHEALKQGAFPTMLDPGCDVSILFPYWTDVSDLLSRQKGVSHACEVETALALHLFPDRVRADRIRDPVAGLSIDRYRAFPEGVAQGPPAADWHGGAGFPSAATAAQGERILERLLEPLVAHVRARIA